MMPTRTRAGRRAGAIVLTGLALAGGPALTWSTTAGAGRLLPAATRSGGDPAGAVVGLVCLLTAVVAGWLSLVLLLAVAARLPGHLGHAAATVQARVAPAVVRRWAAIVLGASVTATVLPGTAVAAVRTVHGDPNPAAGAPAPGWRPTDPPVTSPSDPTVHSPTGPPSTTRPRIPAPGWTPRRPVPRQRTDPHLLTGTPTSSPDREVVVRRGDTLWSIAAEQLGPDASSAEIARAWPRWYAANADRIGPDPHTILPGTILTDPTDRHAPGTDPGQKGTP